MKKLLKLFWDKEVIWFYRMKEMKTKAPWPMFIILLVLITIGQHAFALMHFLFESFLYVFNRKAFNRNINLLRAKVQVQQVHFGLYHGMTLGGESIKYPSSIVINLKN